ncbi:MAG TPA: prenyltransferase [Syntrophorhabdales bacterium]|nr:prenyltransferase [Syntrophorhabdales bacterium]
MLKGLVMTIKPESLLISFVAVSAGAAIGSLYGPVHWARYILTLLGMVFMQAGANVLNDYFDYKNKVDTSHVPGSFGTGGRAIARNLLSPGQVLILGLLFYVFTLPIGIYLTVKVGLPVLILGLIGFSLGFFYTGSPIGFKYYALGEPAVFLVWGPLMVSGAYYVQRSSFSGQPVWVSVPVGILVALILFANNIRDLASDTHARVRTIATILRKEGAVKLYRSLIFASYGITLLLIAAGQLSLWALITLISLPLALKLVKQMQVAVPPDADARTAQLNTIYGLFLVISIVLQRLFS